MAVIEWILFDSNGPLWDNSKAEELYDSLLLEHLAAEGISETFETFQEIKLQAVKSLIPSVNDAVLWHFVKPDQSLFYTISNRVSRKYRKIESESFRNLYSLNQGTLRVIHGLSRSYHLGLAVNDFKRSTNLLDIAGLTKQFQIKAFQHTNPFKKPDLRFFMWLIEKTESNPDKIVMVGDRLDMDIIPALCVNMKTICIKRGIFQHQEARSPSEIPHLELHSIRQIPDAIKTLELM